MYRLIFGILSLSVLGTQVASLEPNFNIVVYSEGDYSSNHTEQRPVITMSEHVIPVTFTNSSEPVYDSILFVGDVLLARNVEYLLENNSALYPYEGIEFTKYARNPAVVANFESAVPNNHIPTPVKQIRFSTDKRWLPGLKQAGFTHLSLANNHSDDFGEDGLKHTQKTLKKYGFSTLDKEYDSTMLSVEYIDIEDNVVAIVSCNQLQNGCSAKALKNIFYKINIRSDFQVAYVHWGNEYQSKHSAVQEDLAHTLVNLGADLVVGHHPHVVQDVDEIHGVPIFYSLGNYIFDQYFSTEVQEGLMLHLTFTGVPKVHLLPVSSEQVISQPTEMELKKHQAFLQSLADKSALKLRKHISKGVIPLTGVVATSTKTAMISE